MVASVEPKQKIKLTVTVTTRCLKTGRPITSARQVEGPSFSYIMAKWSEWLSAHDAPEGQEVFHIGFTKSA